MIHDTDILIEPHGTITLLRPMSPAGLQWLEQHVHTEDWQWFGGSVVAEPRYVEAVIDGMESDGLTVEGGWTR